MTRRRVRAFTRAFGAVLALIVALPAGAAELSPSEGYGLVADLLSLDGKVRKAAADRLVESGDLSLVAGIVDAIFFSPRSARGELYRALEGMTGEAIEGYHDWIEWVGAHDEIDPKPGYGEWKQILFSRIDEGYRAIFGPGTVSRIRLEEILSGGVGVAGIPSLDHPPTMPAAEAGYLKKDELVFGIEIGDQARAYPVRFLSWHEMSNDVVGGEPITLSFCTLCGSGIVYSGRHPTLGTLTFDTSGLLYRSNKLMLDREHGSLWSNLTGEPVVGELARSAGPLEVLPSTLTTWSAWVERHPDTDVLDLNAIEKQVRPEYGFRYVPGAADRARSGVAFPVWRKNDRLERNAEVYALRWNGVAKAYPLEVVFDERVVNDVLGGSGLVLVGDREAGAIRAFERGEKRFSVDGDGALVDEAGGRWEVLEDRLQLIGADTRLPRLPGHVAFWFGWYAFYPKTELYEGADESTVSIRGTQAEERRVSSQPQPRSEAGRR